MRKWIRVIWYGRRWIYVWYPVASLTDEVRHPHPLFFLNFLSFNNFVLFSLIIEWIKYVEPFQVIVEDIAQQLISTLQQDPRFVPRPPGKMEVEAPPQEDPFELLELALRITNDRMESKKVRVYHLISSKKSWMIECTKFYLKLIQLNRLKFSSISKNDLESFHSQHLICTNCRNLNKFEAQH